MLQKMKQLIQNCNSNSHLSKEVDDALMIMMYFSSILYEATAQTLEWVGLQSLSSWLIQEKLNG